MADGRMRWFTPWVDHQIIENALQVFLNVYQSFERGLPIEIVISYGSASENILEKFGTPLATQSTG